MKTHQPKTPPPETIKVGFRDYTIAPIRVDRSKGNPHDWYEAINYAYKILLIARDEQAEQDLSMKDGYNSPEFVKNTAERIWDFGKSIVYMGLFDAQLLQPTVYTPDRLVGFVPLELDIKKSVLGDRVSLNMPESVHLLHNVSDKHTDKVKIGHDMAESALYFVGTKK